MLAAHYRRESLVSISEISPGTLKLRSVTHFKTFIDLSFVQPAIVV